MINFDKFDDGLVPAILQDAKTKTVLMLGYMNKEAYEQTIESREVTFFSRSKNALWTKGEQSGNKHILVDITSDCDNDALLLKVLPKGPTCHKGTDTCWAEKNKASFGFLSTLETVIRDRKENPNENSYVSSLFKKGLNKIAQKVGEEAFEVVIESKDDNDILFINESADLLFHYLILLRAKGIQLSDIEKILEERHQN